MLSTPWRLAGKTSSKLLLGSTLGSIAVDTEDLGLLGRTVGESLPRS